MVLTAEVGEKLTMPSQQFAGRSRQTVPGLHVHPEQFAVRALRHASRPADELLTARRAGHGHDDPLAGLPLLGDPVRGAILLEGFIDLIGNPQQRDLAERSQVADPEVVGQRGVDLLGFVDVAVGHAPAQRLGRHVDQLDLVRFAHDLVGDRLALLDPRDLLDDVVHRLEVLDVQ